MNLYELLTVSIIIISIFIGLVVSVWAIGHFFFRAREKREISYYKREDVVVPLTRIVQYKVEMEKEKRVNHEYDSNSDFSEKLELGTEQLNRYKEDNSCSICSIYRVR